MALIGAGGTEFESHCGPTPPGPGPHPGGPASIGMHMYIIIIKKRSRPVCKNFATCVYWN